MLQDIRDRASGWIAWVVIILIGSAFAVFGLSNYMGPGQQTRAVATVNGSEIGRDQVGRAYRAQRQEVEQRFGDDFEVTEAVEQRLRRDALRELIQNRLVADYIEDERLTLADDDLASIIRSQELFQVGGRFSRERYEQVLRANQMDSTQYERQIRQQVLISQLEMALARTPMVTDREMDDLLRLHGQERDLAWLEVDAAAWQESVEVDDADVDAAYEADPDAYTRPERVRLAYVEVRRDALLDRVEVDDDEVEARYEQVKHDRFGEEPRVRARHILLRLDEDADDEAVEDVESRIRELRERIRDGESFASLAEAESEDPGSARRGGDLGRVESGDMVDSFEEALFALDEGELSEPVRTRFGFHLIEATEVSRGDVPPLEDVYDELRRELAEEGVDTLYFEEVERLDEMAYDYDDELETVAGALGLDVRETDWISREGGDDGLAAVDEVVQAAVDPEVLEDRFNSPVIDLDGERALVVRVRDHEPERRLELDEVRDEIESELRERRGREAADSFAAELRDRLGEGESVGDLGDDERVSLTDRGWVDRRSDGIPAPIRSEAFGLRRPDEDEVVTALVQSPTGPVVIVLRGVRDGDPADMAPDQRRQLREQLSTAYGEESVDRFLARLRSEAEIEIHDEDYR